MFEGSCREVGDWRELDRMFFHSPRDVEAAEEAKAICAQCPVLDTCREYALNGAEYGVWGGLTMIEREEIKRGRRGG